MANGLSCSPRRHQEDVLLVFERVHQLLELEVAQGLGKSIATLHGTEKDVAKRQLSVIWRHGLQHKKEREGML